jgi:KUP system potassium uptake protein
MKTSGHGINRLTAAGVIITLGIVYGDIGTSPLYVVNAILNCFGVINSEIIYGSISCVIWTLTLQTTIKYVIITLRADNKGEGGTFALYALIRKKRSWAYIFAIIGGSTLLADGIITPAITVTSAIEGFGLTTNTIIVIVAIILTALFLIQQFGTKKIGNFFGPIMFFWFLMLGVLGILQIVNYPEILKSINPLYAYKLLVNHPGSILVLGAVFLATTGAEALYSDLGHCGIKNIRVSWIYVKTCLIINYLGQGAWILMNIAHPNLKGVNPFFQIMPTWFLLSGTIIATAAAIIASQALISGSFTLISEAIQLNFWPKLKKLYPTDVKGQVYIPKLNWFLWISCLFVVWYFRESANMGAAYGLSITITMLMTTVLLTIYLFRRTSIFIVIPICLLYLAIESLFLISNMSKFMQGGWITIALAGLFCLIMYSWYNARKLKNSYLKFVKIEDYVDILQSLSLDKTVPKYATNLVYITKANNKTDIEAKIIFSIINKHPKRADVYWFIHVDISDSPDMFEYEVTHLVPGKVIKIDFYLGFKVETLINQYFMQVLTELVRNGEVDISSRYDSLRKFNIKGDFKFILIDRIATYDFDLTLRQKVVINLHNIFKKIAIPEDKYLNLDTSNVLVEKVPLTTDHWAKRKIHRVALKKHHLY